MRVSVHTQGADSLQLGDFGRGWRYLVEVGVSEKELNRSGHISLSPLHFFLSRERVYSSVLGILARLTLLSGPF